jgi:DNA polymerase III epsilon subunit family exonuclease
MSHTEISTAAPSYVIYDLETTGLDSAYDDLIQIAAVRFFQGKLIEEDSFFSFARPRQSISSFIQSYTGISNRDVVSAPRPGQVLCDFSRWVGSSTLIAHNGLRFDSKFLTATSELLGAATREISCIDSIHISKMLFGKERGIKHSLDHVKARLGLADSALRRHDARGDVDLLGRAVEVMAKRLGLNESFDGVPRHVSLLPNV